MRTREKESFSLFFEKYERGYTWGGSTYSYEGRLRWGCSFSYGEFQIDVIEFFQLLFLMLSARAHGVWSCS